MLYTTLLKFKFDILLEIRVFRLYGLKANMSYVGDSIAKRCIDVNIGFYHLTKSLIQCHGQNV